MLDLSHLPPRDQLHLTADASALLRHVWQAFPKAITEQEEEEE